MLESGSGHLGYLNFKKDVAEFVPVAFCSGYLRVLDFINEYAVVGLSKQRQNRTFFGLALDEQLKGKNAEARCGIQIIDINSGDCLHSLL